MRPSIEGKKLILTMNEIMKMETTKRTSRNPRSADPIILFGIGMLLSRIDKWREFFLLFSMLICTCSSERELPQL